MSAVISGMADLTASEILRASCSDTFSRSASPGTPCPYSSASSTVFASLRVTRARSATGM